MTKKLKILGPYTPDHDGPYAWITGHPKLCVVHSVVDNVAFITVLGERNTFTCNTFACSVDYIRNAEEVPEAREFWVLGGLIFLNKGEATRIHDNAMPRSELIHVREVLPGEGE
ncbi:hypothetical protein [Acetobacter oryzoeni]|uniref:Uncharacterized protein n=1 Tax=Acetobacter oryzoeni TaxID=2500548 RepID=A0A5B9GNW3_9PROT|nr:hypothetical protein [Acetobacter oryzoeni]MCP1202296.1 hypothetical protein [Acetobacter oryzoeni]QEE86020.1 hypothetical protein EOV40_010080 [Acetobacter oryzoeni]